MSRGIILERTLSPPSDTLLSTVVNDTLFFLNSEYKICKLVPKYNNLNYVSSINELEVVYVAENPRVLMGNEGYTVKIKWDYNTNSISEIQEQEDTMINCFYYSNGMFYIIFNYLTLNTTNFYTYAKSKDLLTWDKITSIQVDSNIYTTDYNNAIYDSSFNINSLINVFDYSSREFQYRYIYINDNEIILDSYLGNNHNTFSSDNRFSIDYNYNKPYTDYCKYVTYNNLFYYLYNHDLYCKNGDEIVKISRDKSNSNTSSNTNSLMCVSNGKLYYITKYGTYKLNDDGISSTFISSYTTPSNETIYISEDLIYTDYNFIYKDSCNVIRSSIISYIQINSMLPLNTSKLLNKNELGEMINHKNIIINNKHHKKVYLGSELKWVKNNTEHVGFKLVTKDINLFTLNGGLYPFSYNENNISYLHSDKNDIMCKKNNNIINECSLSGSVYSNSEIVDGEYKVYSNENINNGVQINEILKQKYSSVNYYEYENGNLITQSVLNTGDSYGDGLVYEPQFSLNYSNGYLISIYTYAISCIIQSDGTKHYKSYHKAQYTLSAGKYWNDTLKSTYINKTTLTDVFPTSIDADSTIIPGIYDVNDVVYFGDYRLINKMISFEGSGYYIRDDTSYKQLDTKYMINIPLSDGKYLYYYYEEEDKIYCVNCILNTTLLIDNKYNISRFFGTKDKSYGITEKNNKKQIYRLFNKEINYIGFTDNEMSFPFAIVGDKYLIGQYSDGKYGIWYLVNGKCRWNTIDNELSSDINDSINTSNCLLSVCEYNNTFALVFPGYTLYFKY